MTAKAQSALTSTQVNPVDGPLQALLGCHRQRRRRLMMKASVSAARWSLTHSRSLRKCHNFPIGACKAFAAPTDSKQKAFAQQDSLVPHQWLHARN
jgi:hypothetical protein